MIKRFQCTAQQFKIQFDKFRFQLGDTAKFKKIHHEPYIYNYTVEYEIHKEEIWADVPGLKGFYQASTLGRIRSKYGKFGSWKVMKIWINPDTGYAQGIFMVNKKRINNRAHRIIAKTFIKNPKRLPEVGFKNGIKADLRPENLYWRKRNSRQ